LTQLAKVSESHLPGAELLADLRTRRGDLAGAAEAWGRVIEIAPFQAETHTARADLFEQLGLWAEAALERQAIVGLKPVDRAEALYDWALALHRGGEKDEARKRVLEALEIAPGYDEALELLLELRQGS
jgi:tetratricopeptide (TPR) repeat protein